MAIRECIQLGILEDYLKDRGSEVYNMFSSEYNKEIAEEAMREEGREEEIAELIKNLYRSGMSIDTIAISTKLPESKVKSIIYNS